MILTSNVGEVGQLDACFSAHCAYIFRYFFHAFAIVTGMDQHVGTSAGEFERDRAADTAGTTGNDGSLASE
jgi:hypothetical protein